MGIAEKTGIQVEKSRSAKRIFTWISETLGQIGGNVNGRVCDRIEPRVSKTDALRHCNRQLYLIRDLSAIGCLKIVCITLYHVNGSTTYRVQDAAYSPAAEQHCTDTALHPLVALSKRYFYREKRLE